MVRARWATAGAVLALLLSGTVSAKVDASAAGRDPAALTDWTAVDAGFRFTCGIRAPGTVWCWGNNSSGQLGDGTTRPHRVPAQVGDDSDWATLSLGSNHACATRSDGSLWCWGYNLDGELGDGTTDKRTRPVQVGSGIRWDSVSAGSLHTCGTSGGELWCWGANYSGQLGDGTQTGQLVPERIGSGTTWRDISAGSDHTCGTQTDDTAWCWGDNDHGQLGDGTTVRRLTPTPVDDLDAWRTASTGAVSNQFSCGIKTSGSAWCWGLNHQGVLGDGSVRQKVRPVRVQGGGTWAQLASGAQHNCAIQSHPGSLWCWGRNQDGQLGIGSTEPSRTPVRVGFGKWLSVAAGGAHSCAIDSYDRSLWCWGDNFYGQLGNGTTKDAPSPSEVVEEGPSRGPAYSLNGVAAVAADDVWAVGARVVHSTSTSYIEHFDGASWSQVPSPNPGATTNVLKDVSAVDADDVWAVGSYAPGQTSQALAEHWDGSSWTAYPLPSAERRGLTAVAAVASDDVWAVGYRDVDGYDGKVLIEHWDGQEWSQVPPATQGKWDGRVALDVAVANADDIWLVGVGLSDEELSIQPFTQHWDGTRWRNVQWRYGDLNQRHAVNSVAVVGSDDVWGVGDQNTAFPKTQVVTKHWDGSAWQRVPIGARPKGDFATLAGVTASATNDVWAVGSVGTAESYSVLVEHWNGSKWSMVSAPDAPGAKQSYLVSVDSLTARDAWAVGRHTGSSAGEPLIEHWDGSSWSISQSDHALAGGVSRGRARGSAGRPARWPAVAG